MLLTEDLLHYIWKFRLFDRADLRTTTGEAIEVHSAGLHNTDSGPDFSNARIKIGDTIWAGNVELHLSSSDWKKHNHTTDNAYDNVILHVVYRDDEPVSDTRGRIIPTLELNSRISDNLYNRYHQLIYGKQTIIPCENSIGQLDDFTLKTWFTRILIERLEKKSEAVIKALELNRGDWEETFYQFMAANFGFKVNAVPFELLAKLLPQNILAKHKNNPLQIEALIFGQAGFLSDDLQDEYPRKLKTEYDFLQKKFSLTAVDNHLWKFMRMRPLNFPTVRLAQFAALVVNSNHLFSKVLDIKDVKILQKLFTDIKVNEYWDNHYQFDKLSKPASKNMGQSSANLLLLNTLSLFLFSYGKYNQQQYFIDRSLKLLESLPGEQNNIIADFDSLGVKAGSAFESQALLELKNYYCNYKKCLQCSVGNKILKQI
ncbi:DUF2851 family protein [Mucilaginibacter ximonensis]|uniref:DUF2851 family protein n=1 Tax=Mucilaginibacter ximonensis TaxID=538021 RepID=A0ABW5Y700_9SPHI